MKNKLRKVLSKEIPISVLKKTLALLLTFLMVVTSGDFSGLYVNAVGEETEAGKIIISETDNLSNKYTFSSKTNDRKISAYDLLGDAWNYGITSRIFALTSDSETNFATETIENFPAQTGITDKSGLSKESDSYVGAISEKYSGDLGIKGEGKIMNIHTPETLKNRFVTKGNVKLNFINTSKEDVNKYVENLITTVQTNAKKLNKDSINVSGQCLQDNNQKKYTLDLTNAADDRTYYVNLDNYPALKTSISQDGYLTIKKKQSQTIVFNSSQKTLNIGDIYLDGHSAAGIASGARDDYMEIAGSIICNFPEATQVNIKNFSGILMAPNATVKFSGVDAGWLVASKAETDSSEWHFINTKLTSTPATVTFKAQKLIDNANPTTDTPPFSFKLEKQIQDDQGDITYQVVPGAEAVKNDGNNITFPSISYDGKDDGEHIYRISEIPGDDSKYNYDKTAYYVKVNVSTETEGNEEKTHADVSYYKDAACTEELKAGSTGQTVPTFNNTTKHTTDITISGTKNLEGAELSKYADQFEFNLADDNTGDNKGKIIRTAKLNDQGQFAFAPITFDKAGTYHYTVSETNGGQTIDGITYDGTSYTVEVSVKDDGEGHLTAKAKAYDASGKEFEPNSLTFTNQYQPKSTELSLSGSKSLEGAELSKYADQFEFNLADDNTGDNKGKIIRTAKLNDKGQKDQFTFEPITYDKVGTYQYTVSEKNGVPMMERAIPLKSV
ncbi:Spy0128 family protein [Lachnospiraceae bacterium YH-ros2226]